MKKQQDLVNLLGESLPNIHEEIVVKLANAINKILDSLNSNQSALKTDELVIDAELQSALIELMGHQINTPHAILSFDQSQLGNVNIQDVINGTKTTINVVFANGTSILPSKDTKGSDDSNNYQAENTQNISNTLVNNLVYTIRSAWHYEEITQHRFYENFTGREYLCEPYDFIGILDMGPITNIICTTSVDGKTGQEIDTICSNFYKICVRIYNGPIIKEQKSNLYAVLCLVSEQPIKEELLAFIRYQQTRYTLPMAFVICTKQSDALIDFANAVPNETIHSPKVVREVLYTTNINEIVSGARRLSLI